MNAWRIAFGTDHYQLRVLQVVFIVTVRSKNYRDVFRGCCLYLHQDRENIHYKVWQRPQGEILYPV